MTEQQKQQKIQIKMGNEEVKGSYSNIMKVQHSKEEFCLDFLSVFPPVGSLVARVIISPGHLKRMIRVLQKNLKSYEKQFGTIKETKEPEKPEIGFGGK